MHEVETERSRLRGWREDDLEPFARMNADPEVVRFLRDGKPASRADTEALGTHGPLYHGRDAPLRLSSRPSLAAIEEGTDMSIAIVGGTGDEGFGLALRLAKAGEDVIIGSRSTEKGEGAAADALTRLGDAVRVRGMANADAVAASEAVVVTVPYAGQADTYRSIKDAVRPGAVVCDCTSPLATAVGGRPWQVITPWHGSAAEQAKAILGGSVRMVSAFQTVSGESLQDLDHSLEGDVLVCGTDAEAKATIGALVERVPNLGWVDAGDLSMARVIEPLTAILVNVNRRYKVRTAGIAVTGRPGGWGALPGASA